MLVVRPSAARAGAGEALEELSARLGVTPVVMECPRGAEDLKYRAVTRRYRDADYVLVVGPADFTVHFLRAEHVANEGKIALIDAEGDPEAQGPIAAHVRVAPEIALRQILRRVSETKRAPWIEFDEDEEVERAVDGALHPFTVGLLLRKALSPDDLVILDGGEFCQWVRLALATAPNHVIWNSRLGAIGGSIPLALGAAAAQPERRVIAVIGDGSFGYHGAELETAVREKLKLTVIVGNDSRWAAEWHTQREKYGRAVATMLTPARYDEVARGYGAEGRDVADEPALTGALEEALRSPVPSCLNVRIASVRSLSIAP